MQIKTSSRLHINLLDLSGDYNRAYGGIGFTINDPEFILNAEPSEKTVSVECETKSTKAQNISEHLLKIKTSAEKVINHFNIDHGYHFNILKCYPAHSGLGSGTQMALATARIICEMENIDISTPELSVIVGRGVRSWIGTYAFDNGGFIVEGGHPYNTQLKKNITRDEIPFEDPTLTEGLIGRKSTLLNRLDFPEDWNVIVSIPEADNTITGTKEKEIFRKTCPIKPGDAEKLSYIILMNVIPFLKEHNLEKFGKAINEIQELGFTKVDIDYQPPQVSNLITKLQENEDVACAGLSSWGPAVFSVTDKNPKDIAKNATEITDGNCTNFITKGKNTGYELIK